MKIAVPPYGIPAKLLFGPVKTSENRRAFKRYMLHMRLMQIQVLRPHKAKMRRLMKRNGIQDMWRKILEKPSR